MADSFEEFLDDLSASAPAERLARVVGTIRFDLSGDGRTSHWFVDVTSGKITVSRADHPADCVVHADRALLDAAARGERNLTAAWLRHVLVLNGRVELFRLFERLFPGPSAARDPRDLAPHGPAGGRA